MRFGSACRLIVATGRRGAGLGEVRYAHGSAALSKELVYIYGTSVTAGHPSAGQGGTQATSSSAGWGAWLLALAVAAPDTSSADAPPRQGVASAASTLPGAAAAAAGAPGGGGAPPALTNHPLEYDPVTNEHTAKMTLARTAALDFYNAGKYAQAEAKFREAVSEAQLGFEATDAHIASTKNNLAEFLRNTGRWDEAEMLYKEALDLLESNFGEKHWLYVSALHNLALSYEARGDLVSARATMERVLALRLAMFGPRHFLYADSLFALGHMLRAVPGEARAAMGMMAESVRVLEEAEKLQVNVVLYWLTEIANCHNADGNPEQAAAALRRAVAHMAAERGEEAAAASSLNEQLVDALVAAGRPAAAAEAAAAALVARRAMFGEGALVVAQSELRVAQLQLLTSQYGELRGEGQPPGGPAEGPGPALRALQHAEVAARISAANVEECSKGGVLSGPPPERLIKRLRSAHALGSAAKLVATLAGVGDPAAAAAAEAAAAAAPVAGKGSSSGTSPASTPATAPPSSRSWSWWPFGAKDRSADQAKGTEQEQQQRQQQRQPSALQRQLQSPLPPPEPVAELALADRRLDQAAAALSAATQAGQQLMQAVSSGRRQLPKELSADELASLLVEAQLQLLDVLERLGLVLQARVAAGQGAAAGAAGGGSQDVVSRHRRVLEQQERVAAQLLA